MLFHDSPHKCFYCERPFIDANYGTNKPCAKTRDHIIPLSKSGSSHERNMVYCCTECNHTKGSLSLQEFIDKIHECILSGKTIKTIPQASLSLIVKNASLLILYVGQSGRKLYHFKKKKEAAVVSDLEQPFPTISEIKKVCKKYLKSLGDDAGLSVNTNTSSDHTLFLQSQTVEQFQERKRLDNMVKRLLSAPADNFHYA